MNETSELFEKYVQNRLSKREKALLTERLSEASCQAAFVRYIADWTLLAEATRQIQTLGKEQTWREARSSRRPLRLVLRPALALAASALILAGIFIFEGVETFIDWPLVMLAIGFTAVMGFSVGVLNCYLFHRFEIWQQIWSILTTPLFLISGVILLYEDMPRTAQEVLWYNPLLHLTGLMRAAFYPVYRPDYISLVYIGLWCLMPLVVGMMLMRLFHRDLLARQK